MYKTMIPGNLQPGEQVQEFTIPANPQIKNIRKDVVKSQHAGNWSWENRWDCLLSCGHTQTAKGRNGNPPNKVKCDKCSNNVSVEDSAAVIKAVAHWSWKLGYNKLYNNGYHQDKLLSALAADLRKANCKDVEGTIVLVKKEVC